MHGYGILICMEACFHHTNRMKNVKDNLPILSEFYPIKSSETAPKTSYWRKTLQVLIL